MEWFVVQSQDLHGILSSLGSKVGDEYKVGEKCMDALGEILGCLITEDRIMRNFRRALGIAQVIQTDLIPLLIHAKDDMELVDATIRVLVNLTLPAECLLPVESVIQMEGGHQTVSDLNCLLSSAKQAFVDPRSTLCLVQRMRLTIDKGENISPEDCESISNCLLLLRNILHIPESKNSRAHSLSRVCHSPTELNGSASNSGSCKQSLILWNLFAQNFDKVLLHLMTCPQRAEWEVPMVQLVALTFKDQRMTSLLKMLHLWLETSISSESSEDNESNTSPQPLNQGSGNSSPVLTSEATSDSSDNGGGGTDGSKCSRTKATTIERSKEGSQSKDKVEDVPNDKPTSTTKESNEKEELTKEQLAPDTSGEEPRGGQENEVAEKIEEVVERDEAVAEIKKEREQVEEEEKEEEVKEMVRMPEDNESVDADSGAYSQTASQCSRSSGESKVGKICFVEPKVHSHQCHARHHHHHHRAHTSQYHSKAGKKDTASDGRRSSSSMGSSPLQPKIPSTSEQSDCGYSTQVENQPESLSTSSNEDEGPIAKRKLGHQKHHNMRQHHKVESKNLGNNVNANHLPKEQKCGHDLRRKRLVKRARIHSANIKAMVHHNPTDDDISNLLKEFTLDFLLQGYGLLVSGLHIKLLSSCSHKVPGVRTVDPPSVIYSNSSTSSTPTPIIPELPPPPIDTSHFFWLITFFLRFSSQLGLEFEQVSMVLSYDILSYLVFEGVGLCEEVEIALQNCRESDIRPCLRRIHLVVTAIREFVQAVEVYGKMAMSMPGREGDRAHLETLQNQMASTRDLRCLFVLLLQHYDLSVMSKQYLQDIVVTNHVLLVFLESGGGIIKPENEIEVKNGSRRSSLVEELEMADHITHFANRNIVQQYGHLLEAFQENGEFVNDCVFTMLHHIGGGEVNRAETLFQPTLLRAFSAMWETDFDMCDDWSDLIEYIIYKFISNPQQGIAQKTITPKRNAPVGDGIPSMGNKNVEEEGIRWSVEELRSLRWFYAQSSEEKNVLESIVKLFRQKMGVKKTRKEVLKYLLSQDVINFTQFSEIKNKEFPGDVTLDNLIKSFSMSAEEDVTSLIATLVEEGLERVIHWLQDALLEACYVKTHMMKQHEEGYSKDHSQIPVMEPVTYHYALMGQPIPIVPWGVEEQYAVNNNKSFGRLLHILGIQRPREDGFGGIYPRIPVSLSPVDLLEAARKLGELNIGKLKFDPAMRNVLNEREEEEQSRRGSERLMPSSPIDYTDPKSSHNTPPSHFELNKTPERLSPRTSCTGSQKSPSEMNVNIIRSSNLDWMNIVKRSKSPAMWNAKGHGTMEANAENGK